MGITNFWKMIRDQFAEAIHEEKNPREADCKTLVIDIETFYRLLGYGNKDTPLTYEPVSIADVLANTELKRPEEEETKAKNRFFPRDLYKIITDRFRGNKLYQTAWILSDDKRIPLDLKAFTSARRSAKNHDVQPYDHRLFAEFADGGWKDNKGAFRPESLEADRVLKSPGIRGKLHVYVVKKLLQDEELKHLTIHCRLDGVRPCTIRGGKSQPIEDLPAVREADVLIPHAVKREGGLGAFLVEDEDSDVATILIRWYFHRLSDGRVTIIMKTRSGFVDLGVIAKELKKLKIRPTVWLKFIILMGTDHCEKYWFTDGIGQEVILDALLRFGSKIPAEETLESILVAVFATKLGNESYPGPSFEYLLADNRQTYGTKTTLRFYTLSMEKYKQPIPPPGRRKPSAVASIQEFLEQDQRIPLDVFNENVKYWSP